ncbi:MAG: hypothetical protein IIC24_06360 [Chloroflexi bacterium]|nr:hypothetical protein [Chloroflexota bacterium]
MGTGVDVGIGDAVGRGVDGSVGVGRGVGVAVETTAVGATVGGNAAIAGGGGTAESVEQPARTAKATAAMINIFTNTP